MLIAVFLRASIYKSKIFIALYSPWINTIVIPWLSSLYFGEDGSISSHVSFPSPAPLTHCVYGEELGEVGLRVAQEAAVPVGVVREGLSPSTLRAGQQDADLGRPHVVGEVLIGR